MNVEYTEVNPLKLWIMLKLLILGLNVSYSCRRKKGNDKFLCAACYHFSFSFYLYYRL